jgi:lipid-A-disaccharide synthase
MKYYIIAGEASGDLHAANLVTEINKLDADAQVRAWGGELLENQGAVLAKNYKETAFMGVVEVLKNLSTINKLFAFCKSDILKFQPDLVILVDYPGFNLRMAEFTKANNILTYYYISPKIWAWKQKRAYKIKAFIDKMFVIFPFEIDFYKQFDYPVHYIGNPLLDEIERQKDKLPELIEFRALYDFDKRPIIALLAGSRMNEITTTLPVMTKVAKNFPQFQFIVAGAPGIEKQHYTRLLNNTGISIVYNQTYALLKNSKAAIVASGTATLETALFNVPQVVVYKMNAITALMIKMVIKIQYISLVNIILKREAVKELLQNQFNEKNVSAILSQITTDSPEHEKMFNDYKELHALLGEKGASAKAAQIIVSDLKNLK